MTVFSQAAERCLNDNDIPLDMDRVGGTGAHKHLQKGTSPLLKDNVRMPARLEYAKSKTKSPTIKF